MTPGDPVQTPYGFGFLVENRNSVYGLLRTVEVDGRTYTLDPFDVWPVEDVGCPCCRLVVPVKASRTVPHFNRSGRFCPGSFIPLVVRFNRIAPQSPQNAF